MLSVALEAVARALCVCVYVRACVWCLCVYMCVCVCVCVCVTTPTGYLVPDNQTWNWSSFQRASKPIPDCQILSISIPLSYLSLCTRWARQLNCHSYCTTNWGILPLFEGKSYWGEEHGSHASPGRRFQYRCNGLWRTQWLFSSPSQTDLQVDASLQNLNLRTELPLVCMSARRFTQVAKSGKFHAYTVDLRSTCVDMRWVAKR